MKEYTLKLTESEIDTLMYVLEGYSAKVKIEAYKGLRDKEKAKKLTNECCQLNSKLYREMLKIHGLL